MRFKCIDCKESFAIERPNLVDFNYCPRCGRTMWGMLPLFLHREEGYLYHQHPIPDDDNRSLTRIAAGERKMKMIETRGQMV